MVDCCGVYLYMGPFAVEKITGCSRQFRRHHSPEKSGTVPPLLALGNSTMPIPPILIPKGTNGTGRCRWNWPITASRSIYWHDMPASARLVGRCACVVVAAAQLVVDRGL